MLPLQDKNEYKLSHLLHFVHHMFTYVTRVHQVSAFDHVTREHYVKSPSYLFHFLCGGNVHRMQCGLEKTSAKFGLGLWYGPKTKNIVLVVIV